MNKVSIPASMLSTQVSDTLARVPESPALYQEIEQYQLTMFHLTLGLVPSGMPVARFAEYRDAYLREFVAPQLGDVASKLQQITPFILLHDSSSSEDIKAFLLNAGVAQDRVQLLPSTLTYQDLKEGRLDPALEDEHLAYIKDALESDYFSMGAFSVALTEDTMNSIDSAVRSLYKISVPLMDHLKGLSAAGNVPTSVVPYMVRRLTMKPIQLKYPGEFDIAYSNFDLAIQQGLVPELARLKRAQVRTGKFGQQPSYSPIVHLTNCSGSGKTRSCLEMGRLTSVLFLKFGGNNGIEVSFVGKAIVSFLHNLKGKHWIEGLQIMNAILKRVLFVCGEMYQLGLMEKKAIIVDSVIKEYLVKVLGYQETQKDDFVAQINSILFNGLCGYTAELKTKILFDTNQITECLNPASLDWIITKADNTRFVVSSADMEETVESWLLLRHKELIQNLPQSTRAAAASLPPLLIVLDEAHSLMQEFEKGSIVPLHFYGDAATEAVPGPTFSAAPVIDVYRVFRACLRFFRFYWEFSVTITVSTLAKVQHFNPPPTEDPSYRPQSTIRLNNPIVLFNTFDCYRVGVFGEASREDWLDFVFSRERFLHVGACGRPLWGLYFGRKTCDIFVEEAHKNKQKLSDYLQDCVALYDSPGYADLATAFFKLGNKVRQVSESRFKFDCPIGANESAALLGLAVGLQKYPKEVNLAELVQYGPFPAVGMDMLKRTVDAVACSEGIFNGAATLMLIEHLEGVADWLYNYVSSTDRSFFSQEEIGELVSRISLLKALQTSSRIEWMLEASKRCRDSEFQYTEAPRSAIEAILEPVGLESFLCQLVGQEATVEYLTANPGLKGSFLGMSHFAYMGIDWVEDDPYDALANALSRGMGIVPRAGSKGFDTIMPLVLSNGKMSFVYVQTKLSSSKSFPGPKLVRSSAPDTCLSNVDVNRPYCYLFQKYTDASPVYQVYAKVMGSPENPGHQPCLAVSGRIGHNLPEKFQALIDMYSIGKNFAFVKNNASLMCAWRLPSKVNSTADSCKLIVETGPLLTMHTKEQWDCEYESGSRRQSERIRSRQNA